MKIVVTIPACNEEKTIAAVIEDIKEAMGKERYNYDILVVDDGSKDNTAAIAKKSGAIVTIHPLNYGLAETFKTEMEECLKLNADIIVHIDADGQYLASEIPKLIEEVKKGNDLVLGSRFKGRIEGMSVMRRIGNRAFSRSISQVVGVRINDCQTGFRAFTKEVAKIDIISNFTYTQEQIIKAVKKKFRIKEVPVYFAKRKSGKSRLASHPLRYATRAWVNILRVYRDYEPLKFFGAVGFLFFMAGFLIGLWLLYIFIVTGRIGRLPFVMLSVLLISMGIQTILFGFLADMGRK